MLIEIYDQCGTIEIWESGVIAGGSSPAEITEIVLATISKTFGFDYVMDGTDYIIDNGQYVVTDF